MSPTNAHVRLGRIVHKMGRAFVLWITLREALLYNLYLTSIILTECCVTDSSRHLYVAALN